MCPVEIGPDGSPIVTPPVTTTNPTTPIDQTTGSDSLTDTEVIEQVKPQTREDFLKAMKDIVRRYTSDTQSYEKCVSELTQLIPE